MADRRPDWQGAISFAGLPIPLAFFGAVEPDKSVFKMLDPDHKQPVKQAWRAVDGTVLEREQTLRGVEYGDGYVAINGMPSLNRTELCEIERFSPDKDIPYHLARGIYYVGPRSKAPGSETSVQALWNALVKTKRVAVIKDWVARAGSRPWTVVLRADQEGITAFVLPYATQVRVNDVFTPEVNARAAKAMATIIEADYETAPFDHAAYEDTFSQRRDAAIESVLKGAPALPAPAPMPNLSVDLIAGLEALAAKKASKPKRAPRARKAAA